MTNVELSPAELEMIKLTREKEALAKKEAEAKKAIQLEKDIADKKVYITKSQAKDAAQMEAANKYASELGGGCTITVYDSEELVKVVGEYLNPENPSESNYEREILWSESLTRKQAWIVCGDYTIRVVEQITYGKWSTRGTSQGYKMYISGPGIDWKQSNRAYSRATKVNEVIKEAIDQIDYERKQAEVKKNAVQTTMDRFTAEYPDAEITADKGWEKGYGRNSYNGVSYDMVRIKFANGASIAYRVYSDGSLGRVSFNLPSAKDEAAFRNNLSQMKF